MFDSLTPLLRKTTSFTGCCFFMCCVFWLPFASGETFELSVKTLQDFVHIPHASAPSLSRTFSKIPLGAPKKAAKAREQTSEEQIPRKAPLVVSIKSSSTAKRTFALSFEKPTRLSSLVLQGAQLIRGDIPREHAHASEIIYWLGAGLFQDAPSQKIPSDLGRVLDKIGRLKNIWHVNHSKYTSLVSLEHFLKQSQFKTRIWATLDEDLFLIGRPNDPLIKGALTLILPPRPSHIWVLGAVKENSSLDHVPGRTTKEYLTQASLINVFNVNQVFVIEPNGKIQTHKVAYWNHLPKEVAPGGIIYVPYQDLPSSFSSLNQEIAELLQHRVL